MPTVEAELEIRDLCRQVAIHPSPAHRVEALEQIRDLIRHRYRLAESPEEKCNLQIAEQIFDFIEETFPGISDR